MEKVTLFKIIKEHESIIGSNRSSTFDTLAYFESEEQAKRYLRENNLVWRGNSTGSVDYIIKEVEFYKPDEIKEAA
jgi:hypothetical protein